MRSSANSRAVLSLLIFVAGVSSAAGGKVIRVDADAPGANDGSSWRDAYLYLQDAFKAARSGDTIFVAEGTYKPDQGGGNNLGSREAAFQLKLGVVVNGGYAGFGGVDPDVRDMELYKTVLSGDLGNNDDLGGSDTSKLATEPSRADNSYHVVTANGVDASTVLDGFIIMGGNANGSAGDLDKGGGLYCYSASPVLAHCAFRANSAISYGGGLYNRLGSPELSVCAFNGNRADWGGGMYNSAGSPTVTDCDFAGNSATYGGAMRNRDGCNLKADHCTFRGNDATDSGGAMYNYQCSPTVTDCNFTDNSARYGAAMRNYDGSNSMVNRCRFSENYATESGGGMYNYQSSPIVTDCNFTGNSARYGGAIRNCDGSNPMVNRCRFSENDADKSGGGMYSETSEPSVIDCDFTSNSATYGAGMFNDESNSRLAQCDFIGNLAEHGGGIYNDRSSPSIADCNFIDNSADYGAGMRNDDADGPAVHHCWFKGNHATRGGGGIYSLRSSPTITDCNFIDNSAAYGAGVRTDMGNVTIRDDCWFVRNHASVSGGGMYNAENSPMISDSNFVDNDTTYGGGMYNTRSWPTVTSCLFVGNSATYGGGMHNYDGSCPMVDHCTFRDNDTTEYGGGIYNEQMSSPTVTNCDFIGNTATYGGGMRNYDDSNPTVDRCRFDRNAAGESGGGMCNSISSPIVRNCIFTKNAADWGGAMRNSSNSAKQNARVVSCLFSGNWALDGGGGVGDWGYGLVLTNCTFVYNSANTGGALYCGRFALRTVVRNCALWSNVAAYGPEFAVIEASGVSFSYCDVQGGLEAAYDTTSTGLIWGAGNIELDPLLTPDGHLTAGSPCIDAGDPGTALSDADGNDIDGESRIWGSRIDIGCDEFIDTDSDGLPDAWEQTYFGDTVSGVPEEDPDGDGLTNVEEYALYSSHPKDVPCYVAADRAGDPLSDGSADHPFGSIKEGLSAAHNGGTVLVAPGTYAGSANTGLDFGGKAVVLLAPAGPSATVITGNGQRSLFTFQSYETPASAVIGFTMRNGWADYGGAVFCLQSHPQIRNCVLDSNRAKYRGGAIYCGWSAPRIADCVIAGSLFEGMYILYGGAQIEGRVRFVSDRLETRNTFLWGSGTLEIDSGSVLRVYWDMRIRCCLAGNGRFEIKTNATCTIEGTAIVDLSGEEPEKGQIVCDGLLRMKDQTELRNVNLHVKRAQFEDHVIVSNSVITAEAGTPFGQFFIQDTVRVEGNDIHADGDRYMDLDPATFQGVIANNRIYVTITEGQGNTLGGLLELRGLDRHFAEFPMDQFFCQLSHVPEFDTTTWTIEQLEIAPGAKVNLTNRFDFGNGGLSEVMYVKKLILGDESVLNTAFNRLYYGELESGPAMTATVVNLPILGFSLNTIGFDSADDFASRIVHNNVTQSSDSTYNRLHVDLVTGQEPDPKGMMKMRNLTDLDPNSPTFGQIVHARAKGLFAKSSEREILVQFEYLFRSVEGQLVVYLSDVPELLSYDDPARDEHYVEIGRVTAPTSGWPGSFDSGCFGAFEKIVQVGHLNFLRGTRIELELIGPDQSCVLINNYDPGIRCLGTKCGDVAGSHGQIDAVDFLAVLSECGRRITDVRTIGETGARCLDCYFSLDGVVTIEDALAIEWAKEGAYFPCPLAADSLPFSGAVMGLSKDLGLSRMNQTSDSTGSLLIATKGHGQQGVASMDDYLYRFTEDGIAVGEPSPVPGSKILCKIVRDPRGAICQLDMEQGLLREGRPAIPPGDYPYGSAMVYVGRYPDPDPSAAIEDYVWSIPLQDAAFDKDGCVYIVPVVVNPDAGMDWRLYYRAAAKLAPDDYPSDGGNPTYRVVQLYDISTENGYGLHEIEVDDDGWVYVLKSCPSNTADQLHVFNGITGQPKPGTPLCLSGITDAPTCLHISDKTGKLYLGSALNEPNAVSTHLYVMDKDDPRTLDDVVEIPDMGHMTGITEDPATGTVWVVGFAIEQTPSENAVAGESVLTDCFYRPCIACVQYVGNKPVVIPLKPTLDWLLPISVVWVGGDVD